MILGMTFEHVQMDREKVQALGVWITKLFK